MPPLTGPWCRDLASLQKSISSIPADHQSALACASSDAIDAFCDPAALHVWVVDSDLDALLQVTSVLARQCEMGVRESRDAVQGGTVIVAEEGGRGIDHFGRLCGLVAYLTGQEGRRHLEGAVRAFGRERVVVVRGWGAGDGEKVVKRVSTAVQRALSASKADKIVWHHGAVVGPLLTFVNTTTPALRNALAGISVTDALQLTAGVKPSTAGKTNSLDDMGRLRSYAKKLGIPVLFLDSSSQAITSTNLASYMYFFAYYIHTFLPPSLARPHLHAAQDELVAFAFSLRAASEKRYGKDVVAAVKTHLHPRSRIWARRCIDARSYDKGKCQAMGREREMHHAVQLADTPFALFKTAVPATANAGVPAFARLAVGPASPAPAAKQVFLAAPVDISFTTARLHVKQPSPFFILLPRQNVTADNITNRVQGLMMGVLERVRQEHGNPAISASEAQMWRDVVKACSWALKGCEGKMPSEVAKRVGFVQDKLVKGTWGYVVGAAEEEGNEVFAGGNATAKTVQDPFAQGYAHPLQVPAVNGHQGLGHQGMVQLPPPPQTNFHPQLPSAHGQMQAGEHPATYHQGQASGYAQQVPGGYPTPHEGYAQMRRAWG